MYAEHPDHFGSSQRSVSKQQTRPEGCHKEHFLKSSVINSLSLSSVTNVFTRKRLYSLQTIFLHRRIFPQKCLYAKLLHKGVSTRRIFCTEKLLHTKKSLTKHFTQSSFYTQMPLHIETFTHRNVYTKKIHRETLHTEAFTQKCFDTQMILHTQKLLHGNNLTHRHFLHRFYT